MPPELQNLLDATIESTTRARRVLLVMITASVLVFCAFWNSREGSWLGGRIVCAEAAVARLTAGPAYTGDAAKADLCVANYGLSDADTAKEFLRQLQSHRIENVMSVRIPFFGSVFDVNDLGFLGGLTFAIILLWFRFALWHEFRNLQCLRQAVSGEGIFPRSYLPCVYHALAMRQVLTVPPSIGQPASRERFVWSVAVGVLIALPSAALTAVLCHDLGTFQRGATLSPFNSLFGVLATSALAVLVFVLTVLALVLEGEIVREWRSWARDLQSSTDASRVDRSDSEVA